MLEHLEIEWGHRISYSLKFWTPLFWSLLILDPFYFGTFYFGTPYPKMFFSCFIVVKNIFTLIFSLLTLSNSTTYSAPGIIIAQAEPGRYMSALEPMKHICVISKDGGKTWTHTLDSSNGYVILDHGGLIAATPLKSTMVAGESLFLFCCCPRENFLNIRFIVMTGLFSTIKFLIFRMMFTQYTDVSLDENWALYYPGRLTFFCVSIFDPLSQNEAICMTSGIGIFWKHSVAG